MAETTTTLSSAVAINDTQINVASATGFAIGNLIRIDDEMMVQSAAANGTLIPVRRGIMSATGAHVVTANVQTGLPSDFPANATGISESVTYPNLLSIARTSYTSATAAIGFGSGALLTIAVLNGTSTINATLANPTKDQDMNLLIIAGNGKSVSTVTYTAGLGNAGGSYDVITFPAGGQVAMLLMALNGFWLLLSPMTGTLTSVVPAIA